MQDLGSRTGSEREELLGALAALVSRLKANPDPSKALVLAVLLAALRRGKEKT